MPIQLTNLNRLSQLHWVIKCSDVIRANKLQLRALYLGGVSSISISVSFSELRHYIIFPTISKIIIPYPTFVGLEYRIDTHLFESSICWGKKIIFLNGTQIEHSCKLQHGLGQKMENKKRRRGGNWGSLGWLTLDWISNIYFIFSCNIVFNIIQYAIRIVSCVKSSVSYQRISIWYSVYCMNCIVS